MFAVAAAGILVAMSLALARALLGPTVYDRILAVNTLGTKTVVLLAVIGFLTGRPDWVDLSIAYALINFIGDDRRAEVLRVRCPGPLGPGEGGVVGPLADVLSWIAIVGGLFFMLVGTIGVLRMPDVYTRCTRPAWPTPWGRASSFSRC